MKAQVISMDFIMTFVVFLFSLSVFLFLLDDSLSFKDSSLDVSSELIFTKLEQIYDEEVDFIDNSKIDRPKLIEFIDQNQIGLTKNYRAYDLLFKEFEDPFEFNRIDYCVYLERKQENDKIVLNNFAAGKADGYSIYIDSDHNCTATGTYINAKPDCIDSKKTESIVLTKPVLYQGYIVNLKVLICAQKR